jgi:hypothetical protein
MDGVIPQKVRLELGLLYTLMIANRRLLKKDVAREAGMPLTTLQHALDPGPCSWEQADAIDDAIGRLAPLPSPDSEEAEEMRWRDVRFLMRPEMVRTPSARQIA